jgi:amidase
MRSELDAAVQKMQELGAIICDPADIPSSEQWKTTSMSERRTIIAHEYKEDMKKYLATMKRTDVATMRDIIK